MAYASKMGSTKEIAEAISERLTERGCLAEVRPAETVNVIDNYDAIIVGSAVYAGRWRREAVRFIRTYRKELAMRRVWLFESGWFGQRPGSVVASAGAQRRARRIDAPAPTVFGGRLDPDRATGLLDRVVASLTSGDDRDWVEIRDWADHVADIVVGAAHRQTT